MNHSSIASLLALLVLILAPSLSAQTTVSDDFERPTLGSNWTVLFGGSGVGIINNSDLGLTSSQTLFGLVEWHHVVFASDQFSTAIISTDKADSILTQVFVRRRASDKARYGFHWNNQGNQWEIKYDGVPTAQTRILASKKGAMPLPGDTLRIEIRGMTITGYHNGTVTLSATDTSADAIDGVGQPGMAYRFTIGFTPVYPAPVFESWGAGDLQDIPTPPGTASISVNNNVSHQRMEGFGATTLSLVYGANDYLTAAQRANVIEKLYNQVKLTMGQLEPGLMETPADAVDLWNDRRNDNDDPFIYDQDGFNWVAQDAMKQKVVDLAAPYGVDNFSLANKLTTKGALAFLDPFRTQDYERYLDECAEFVTAGMIRWRDVYGITPRWVAPWNEPTSGNREIVGGTNQLLVDLVKRIGRRLKDAGFGTGKLIVPGEETVVRSYDVAKSILEDVEARQYVGAISYHPYPYESPYSSVRRILQESGRGLPMQSELANRQKLRNLGTQYSIPIWMVEVSEGPGNNDYSFEAFENVRARAIHIHDEFRYADASAYYGMNAMMDRRSHEEHFAGRGIDFFTESSSIALIDTDRVIISGMGYAIGHYARWIPRGAVRIESSSSDSLVQITTFRDTTQGRLVFVIINNAMSERMTEITLDGASLVGSVVGEQSTAGRLWSPLPAFTADGKSTIRLTLPAESITTLASGLEGPTAGVDATPPRLSSEPKLQVFPNPVNESMNVQLSLFANEDVRLILTDVLGRNVKTVIDGPYSIGNHMLNVNMQGIPTGTYLLTIRAGARTVSVPVTIAR
jgi:O-glycosyl hydrolase